MLEYLLAPVGLTRYFEFPFSFSWLPQGIGRCLDVSSPRLFSLFVASHCPSAKILAINPDARDLQVTGKTVQNLGLTNLETKCCMAHDILPAPGRYHVIWAISVLEHISGEYDDCEVVQMMFNSLRVGGRLILTIPTGPRFELQYRDDDIYDTQRAFKKGHNYFFQRIYDAAAIEERLLVPVGGKPTAVRWFGETSCGRFRQHEEKARRLGLRCAGDGAREIADHFRSFDSWEQMPGYGVCGLVIDKTC